MRPGDPQDSELLDRRDTISILEGSDKVEACWVCGHRTQEIHCRIICPNCGFTRDCSDP